MKTRKIQTKEKIEAVLTLPGSKSYTHRALIAAALAPGESLLTNALKAEDTELTAQALASLGADLDWQGHTVRVQGTGGRLVPESKPLYLGNSGTSMRFLTAVAALGPGTYRLTGTLRLCQRPMGELLEALRRPGGSGHLGERQQLPPDHRAGGHLCGRENQPVGGSEQSVPVCPAPGRDP